MYALTLFGLARAIQRIGTSSTTSPFALHRSAGTLVQAVRHDQPGAVPAAQAGPAVWQNRRQAFLALPGGAIACGALVCYTGSQQTLLRGG